MRMFLSGGPGHWAAAEEVDVEVSYGLTAVVAGVDDYAIAFAKAFVAGNLCSYPEKVAEERRVMRACFGE